MKTNPNLKTVKISVKPGVLVETFEKWTAFCKYALRIARKLQKRLKEVK